MPGRRSGLRTLATVTVAEIVLATVPRPYRALVFKHRELLKFGFVGGLAWIVDAGSFALLNQFVFDSHPLTAKTISLALAGVVSYYLSRGWSFRTRGGRDRHHEVLLFVVMTVLASVVNLIPLGISHYLLDLQVPNVSYSMMKIADFISANVFGTALGFIFRYWASKRFVFPEAKDAAEAAPVTAKDDVDPAS